MNTVCNVFLICVVDGNAQSLAVLGSVDPNQTGKVGAHHKTTKQSSITVEQFRLVLTQATGVRDFLSLA